MKKKVIFAILFFSLFTTIANAHPYAYHHTYCSGYHSSHYVVNREYIEDTVQLPNCKTHSLLSQTTILYYSDGSRRSYTYYTILKNDGSVLREKCLGVEHVVFNKKHYFLINTGKKYEIITEDGTLISKRNYSKMMQLKENRILVKCDKKYGIIDIQDNIIVPIKYKSFKRLNDMLYMVKLNGYYGIIDSNNNKLVKCQLDKITTWYDTYLLKKEGKYGLCDLMGNVIYDIQYDKIKKLGEYILIKKDKKYQVLNPDGNLISNEEYEKIKLDRNVLLGKKNGKWIDTEEL